MEDNGTQFYHKDDHVFLDLKDLDIVDESEEVWIATQKDWKCERVSERYGECKIDYKHEHGIYKQHNKKV